MSNSNGILESLKREGVRDTFGSGISLWVLAEEIDDLYESALESAEQLEEWENNKTTLSPEQVAEAARDVSSYFTFTSQITENLLAEAVYRNLITDEHRNKDTREGIHQNLGYYDCLNIIHTAGIINDGTKGEIVQTRKVRNKLVHDTSERKTLSSIDAPVSQIDRAYRSIERLADVCTEEDQDELN